MNPNTGEIVEMTREELKQFEEQTGQRLIPLTAEDAETLRPIPRKRRKGWMRNQPCPCGSKRKFKKCCWHRFA